MCGAIAVHKPVSAIETNQDCQQDYCRPFQKHAHWVSTLLSQQKSGKLLRHNSLRKGAKCTRIMLKFDS
jgi:hypothetical protein